MTSSYIPGELIRFSQMNPEKRAILPSLAFNGFRSRYQQPVLSEGFKDIIEVDFRVSLPCKRGVLTDLAYVVRWKRGRTADLDSTLDLN
jgi:hypothetical protein